MILLDRVSKTYPGVAKPALDNVSLHIEPNEFVFLVGKSGAGKSTLIKMITKEEFPDHGKIIIGGIDLDYVKKRHIPHYRRRLGVVFQDFKLLPTRTVYENVAFSLEIAGMSNREIHRTVPKVLDLVGLPDKGHKFPGNLSGGEQQRVCIARSIARQPKILIADEPTGNLDPATRQGIIDLLQKINDYGTTVLVTTHDETVVNHLQKRVISLKNGQIVSDQKHGFYRLDAARPATASAAAASRAAAQSLARSPSAAPTTIFPTSSSPRPSTLRPLRTASAAPTRPLSRPSASTIQPLSSTPASSTSVKSRLQPTAKTAKKGPIISL